MLRILFAHYSVSEYMLFKTDLHKISTELTVSHIDCDDKLLNLLQYFIPDVLFMDILIKDKVSIRCLQKLRSEQRFRSMPVVIYSYAADWSYVKEYYFSDANYYMAKPYSFENLGRTLEQAFTPHYSKEQYPLKTALVTS